MILYQLTCDHLKYYCVVSIKFTIEAHIQAPSGLIPLREQMGLGMPGQLLLALSPGSPQIYMIVHFSVCDIVRSLGTRLRYCNYNHPIMYTELLNCLFFKQEGDRNQTYFNTITSIHTQEILGRENQPCGGIHTMFSTLQLWKLGTRLHAQWKGKQIYIFYVQEARIRPTYTSGHRCTFDGVPIHIHSYFSTFTLTLKSRPYDCPADKEPDHGAKPVQVEEKMNKNILIMSRRIIMHRQFAIVPQCPK